MQAVDDDDFQPKLGRIRSTGTRNEKTYLQRVLHSAARAGGRFAKTNRGFDGSRIGRGAGVARILRSRDRFAAFRSRRVAVKARIVKLAGRGLAAARAHLRYIQRDGVTRDGQPGSLYDRESDKVDRKSFIDRAEGDRHQFRFIVSPEDGAQYDDLKPFVRKLMDRMEKDLGTKLDWVAADHYNTGHPHSHIVVRGKRDDGRDLIIAREYITHGLRERAAEIVSLDLGPRSELENQDRLRHEMEQERFTSLDRDLLKHADADLQVTPAHRDPFRQMLRAGRLKKLERLGLAVEIEPGRWRLASDLQTTLRAMGERGDIIKTMNRDLSRLAQVQSDYAIYDPQASDAERLVGRVAAQGLSDELHDRRYLILEGVDGRAHYVELGFTERSAYPDEGGIVAITASNQTSKAADRTVAQIAAGNGGRYSVAIHMAHDSSASQPFIASHLRRLEALRKGGLGIKRGTDGTWTIAPDHVVRAEIFERAQVRFCPVQIELLSPVSIERQVSAIGATWLDRELTTPTLKPENEGFGREMREALDRRRQWLLAENFAREANGRVTYPGRMLSDLQRAELAIAGGEIAARQGKPFVEAKRGNTVAGIYKRRIDLASGRFAVIENDRTVTLVPWRPVLERNLGKEVSGIARGETISWTLGKQRGGPSL
ncbi:MAG TPA: relaxase/mobilization nuclease RlxS [Rhizomicrobium sp.]|nr:relaxase/mobilization nuclease RlxS [Rhizomicrobium sp.]